MVRITRVGFAGAHAGELRVEGQLAGRWALELERTAADLLAETPSVSLDLAGVTFVDRDGADVLQRLRRRGIALMNATAYLASLLNGETQ